MKRKTSMHIENFSLCFLTKLVPRNKNDLIKKNFN